LLQFAGGATANGAAFPPAIEAGSPESPPQLPACSGAAIGDNEEVVLAGLWNVLRHYQFRFDPLFVGLKLLKPDAEALLRTSCLSGHPLAGDDLLWLNRHLIEAAFRQATGRACFRRLNGGLDGVLVSDVGKPIEVQSNRRAGGLIRTALRASDILMDRVWQLEIETFQGSPGFVFAPITEVVEPAEDATALHPEVQRQVARIRTDLDRFSPLEISSLVRHGYSVCRKVCRANRDLFGADLPGDSSWDPLPASTRPAPALPRLTPKEAPSRAPAAATTDARALQGSALRRIWSTLFDGRDWVSYIYVPILVPLLVVLPYVAVRSLERARRLNQLVQSFSQGTRDLETLSEMLDNKPSPWTGEQPERVRTLDEPDLTGFDILQDSRIFDLRAWQPGQSENDEHSVIYLHRRLKVVKQREDTKNSVFRAHLLPTSPKAQVRFPAQQLRPKLRMCAVDSLSPGREEWRWEASFDFQGVPAGEYVDLVMEELSPGEYTERRQNGAALSFVVQAETAELSTWLLMPRDKEYRTFRISRHQTGKPETAETVRVVTEYLAEDSTILAFRLLALKPGWTYEVSWVYK